MGIKYRHWFFDLDGTLARPGEDIVVAWKAALTSLGRDLTDFDRVFRIGPTLEKVVYELYDDATPQLVEDLMARFKPLYDEGGFPNTVPYPGVPGLLAALKAAGAKAYIVTNKRHSATQLIARKFGWDRTLDGVWSYDTFETKYKKAELLAAINASGGKAYIVTNKRHNATQLIAKKFGWDRTLDGVWSYDTFETKCKKSELLAKLLKDLGVDPKDSVMVGDTKGDVDAGKANGMATIGVTYGYGTPDEVSSADHVFASAVEIAKNLVK